MAKNKLALTQSFQIVKVTADKFAVTQQAFMTTNWESIFDNFGIKTVSKTDKSHHAYVPNAAQRRAILAAGICPAKSRPAPPLNITVLLDDARTTVVSGYYHAIRSTDAKRQPEPRMGQAFITAWLETGDKVLIGNIGTQLFTLKVSGTLTADENLIVKVAQRCTRKTIIARAQAASSVPEKRATTRIEFRRNPFVVLAALVRADNQCELPDCRHELFTRDDGSFYLEVHHLVPLTEGGDDSLLNVAALCPHCHRELHSGAERTTLRATLQHHITGKLFP